MYFHDSSAKRVRGVLPQIVLVALYCRSASLYELPRCNATYQPYQPQTQPANLGPVLPYVYGPYVYGIPLHIKHVFRFQTNICMHIPGRELTVGWDGSTLGCWCCSRKVDPACTSVLIIDRS